YDRALFVFNDNATQFRSHRRHAPGAQRCSPGGGNAVIRPYQCQVPVRATGIPTGDDGRGFARLTDEVRGLIDEAVTVIEELLSTGRYDVVFYSGDGHGSLGTGIFDVGADVKDYIVERLEALGTPSA
ncbi:MAG: hypothetical protein AB7Q27_09805, partial [Acidimicrobiia bacterium]